MPARRIRTNNGEVRCGSDQLVRRTGGQHRRVAGVRELRARRGTGLVARRRDDPGGAQRHEDGDREPAERQGGGLRGLLGVHARRVSRPSASGRPSNRHWPAFGASKPVRRLKNVVLPARFGPMRAVIALIGPMKTTNGTRLVKSPALLRLVSRRKVDLSPWVGQTLSDGTLDGKLLKVYSDIFDAFKKRGKYKGDKPDFNKFLDASVYQAALESRK